jgi:hypothetical protein
MSSDCSVITPAHWSHSGEAWQRGALSDEPITLELMLRAIEVLQQRPEYQSQAIEKLTKPAYDLLAKCNLERELAHNSWVTYHEGIARVTGFKRVKKEQVALFEQYNSEVCNYRSYPWPGPDELKAWQARNLFPVWVCQKMAIEFSVWDGNRRSKLAKDKNNLKKLVAPPPRAKETT